MDNTNIQNMANEDFMNRAKDFDLKLRTLKQKYAVEIGVNLAPASWLSDLLSKTHLIKIKYDLTYTDNKKID